jgi:UDP-N-acetylglucosamine 2-epimerase (non-hydrolysing)
MNVLIVIGTRPNFIKVTQFRSVAALYPNIDLKFVHTGQHYDGKMADIFFQQFNLIPDFFLNVPAGNPMEQMTEIKVRLEKIIFEFYPDLMIVVGDVNSTLAAAQTATKLGIRLAHVESGLRSFDDSMPEEYNRIQTDGMADFHFVTEQAGLDNLANEGKKESGIFFVGNTMIDTMVAFSSQIDASFILDAMNLRDKNYVLMTMHRPATVDNEEGLTKLLTLLDEITQQYDVVFPIHPRTINKLKMFGLEDRLKKNPRIKITEPLDYFAFQKLIKCCKFILTDSGGIQEESTFLQVPCLTLRPNTERPITVTLGSNELLPFDIQFIREKIKDIESGKFKKGNVPPLWDGKATDRILKILAGVL